MKVPSALAIAAAFLAVVPGRADQPFPEGEALVRAARTGAPIEVSLGRRGTMALHLREHNLLDAGTVFTARDGERTWEVDRPLVTTLAGSIVGDPSSVVRLTVSPRGIRRGFIASRRGSVSIDERGLVADPVSALGPLIDEPIPIEKGHGSVPISLLGVGNCSVLPCGTLTAHVVLDGDDSHRSADPSTCMDRQIAVLNDVDGIYALTETDIRLDVTQVNCWTTNASLGDATTDPAVYLNNVRLAWTNVGADRSTVMHAVGFDFTATAIGVAYVGGICTRLEPTTLLLPGRCPYGYGLYQSASTGGYAATGFLQAKVAAHELGHNFNAEHATATGCETGNGTIMCASLQTGESSTFSPASAAVIRAHAEDTIGFFACPVGRDGSIASSDC